MSRYLLLLIALASCKDDRAAKAQQDFDRAIEKSGGIERDQDGRPYDKRTGKYLDARGGKVAPSAVEPPPGRLPPPPETDVTRGLAEEYGGSKDKARELYKKACVDKVAGGCARAILIDRQKDPGKAATAAKALCDGGDAAGCYALGVLFETVTLEQKHDAPEIAGLYEKGCTGGFPDACQELGMFYYSGRSGGTKDPAKAADALTRGCKLGDQMSCDQAGMVGGR